MTDRPEIDYGIPVRKFDGVGPRSGRSERVCAVNGES